MQRLLTSIDKKIEVVVAVWIGAGIDAVRLMHAEYPLLNVYKQCCAVEYSAMLSNVTLCGRRRAVQNLNMEYSTQLTRESTCA